MSSKLPPSPDAPSILDAAAKHMRDRAATYDKPEGERSMAATVDAFNIITGRSGDEPLLRLQSLFSALRINLQSNCPLDRDVLIERMQTAEHFLGLLSAPALSESEGWLLMQVLKDVRDRQRAAPHRDSLEDCTAYSALKAEARLREESV